jgi:gliding motility-associated-like protein
MRFSRLAPALTLLWLCSFLSSSGGQFAGGHISYRYINKFGNEYVYELTLKLYRDCFTEADLADPVISMINSTDLTRNIHPQIYREYTMTNPVIRTLPYSSKSYCSINDPTFCIEERTYVQQIGLPYSPEGFTFYYTICCRNGLGNLQNDAGNGGVEIINTIPVGGQALTYVTYIPSHDSVEVNSSPASINDSVIYACKGKPLQYRFQFVDADGDSVVVRPASSLMKVNAATTSFFPIFFRNGYTEANPAGGAPSMTLDEKGVFSGTPDRTGAFALAMVLEEYRNGKLINTSRKDFQVNVYDCAIRKPDDIINCNDQIAGFLHTNNAVNSYHWDFGVSSFLNDTSAIQFPIYVYPQTGTFRVRLKVTNPAGCSDSIFSIAKIYPGGLQVNFDWTGQACKDQPLQLNDRTVAVTGSVPVSWIWRELHNFRVIGTGPSITYTHPVSGTMPYPLALRLTVQSDLGCKDSLSKDILIYETVNADAGPDKVLPIGQSYQFNGNSSTGPNLTYTWSPATGLDDPFTIHPTVSGDRDMQYILTVSNEVGCMDKDTVSIRFMKGPAIYVPTAFTPNGDGLNDVLRFSSVGVEQIRFEIFNRWGQRVFLSTDPANGWDGRVKGKIPDTAVFVWSAKGTGFNGLPLVSSGTVTLIR